MKTTRFFAAALALLSVLSCQKEEQQVTGNSENKGGALITCGFANNDPATKTTLDGFTPKWTAGDKIMLYDGISNKQELTLASSGEPSSTQGIIDSTNATMFAFLKPEEWVNVYAIYPSSACVSGFSASNPQFNFAGQDGSFAKANICVAVDVSDTMSFKNVGAILKFPSKAAAVTDVLIPVDGLAKDYIAYFSGRTPSLTPVDATNSKSYSIGSGTGVIYIGVPAGKEIAKGSAFVYKDASSIQGCYLTGAANTPAANKIYTLPAIEANGKLPGVFTVGAASGDYTGKVQFSKGNLQAAVNANGKPTEWNFADNQYGYIGSAVANNSIGKTAGVVDLFGWSTSTTTYGISTSQNSSNYSGDFVDWGGNAIANGGNTADLWKTLTSAEWTYLLSTRTVNGSKGEGKSYQRTTLTLSDNTTTVYGLIIAPDNYTGSLSATTSWSDWQTMETAGCVFLPAARRRQGSSISTQVYGYYWSATPNTEDTQYAYHLLFYNSWVDLSRSNSRYLGLSVRLVCAAQ